MGFPYDSVLQNSCFCSTLTSISLGFPYFSHFWSLTGLEQDLSLRRFRSPHSMAEIAVICLCIAHEVLNSIAVGKGSGRFFFVGAWKLLCNVCDCTQDTYSKVSATRTSSANVGNCCVDRRRLTVICGIDSSRSLEFLCWKNRRRNLWITFLIMKKGENSY